MSAVAPTVEDTPASLAPVPQDKLQQQFGGAVAAWKADRRRDRRYAFTLFAGVALLTGYSAFISWENRKLAQLAAENANRVIYVTLRDDGTLVNSVMYTSLPPKWTSDNRLNTLWDYVFFRECYSESSSPRDYYIVQRMSDTRVRTEYINHMSKENPNSPRNKLGKLGHYFSCDPISYTPVGSDDDRFEFRFMRYHHNERGFKDRGISMHVAVQFRTGIWPSDEHAWKDKSVWNAPGIQVIEYPGARPDAVQHHLLSDANAAATVSGRQR
jgi:hypothetical protein